MRAMKVRVIDDDHSIIMLLQIILEELEDIDAIITGSDFERLFEPELWEDIDGALIDLNLRSHVTGADILAYLYEHHPHIRRVAFTALQFAPQDLAELAHVVLTKPADAHQIGEALRG